MARKRINIDKEKFIEDYKTLTNVKICKKLKITAPTLSKIIDRLGIERKKAGRKKIKINLI
jgi:hypothetical protein